MSAFWRAAGLTYVNYSSIAAKVTRQALKSGAVKVNIHSIGHIEILDFVPNLASPRNMQYPQDAAAKREITSVKFQKWEAGKPVGAKF